MPAIEGNSLFLIRHDRSDCSSFTGNHSNFDVICREKNDFPEWISVYGVRHLGQVLLELQRLHHIRQGDLQSDFRISRAAAVNPMMFVSTHKANKQRTDLLTWIFLKSKLTLLWEPFDMRESSRRIFVLLLPLRSSTRQLKSFENEK